VQVTLNVLAELFGGLWFPGNAVAMNYFKVKFGDVMGVRANLWF
jgi:hypothetical protein